MRTAVLINNFNNGRYIRACVDSVLEQTEPADEIIVYDDGSTDDSVTTLRSYGDRIHLITGKRPVETRPWVNQENAIARALESSTAEIVILLDGDDMFTLHKVAKFRAAFAERSDCIMVQAPMQLMDEAGNLILEPDKSDGENHACLQWVMKHHDLDVFVPTSGQAFRREFLLDRLKNSSGSPRPLWADVRLGCHALLLDRIHTLPERLGLRRLNPNSHYTAGSFSPGFRLKDTLNRTRFFNHLCRQEKKPEISVWKNHRFYRHVLRALIPSPILRSREKITPLPNPQPKRDQ